MTTTTLATAREAREYLKALPDLPAGVHVGQRGRLSQAAKDFFFEQTGKIIVSPVTDEGAE